MEALHDIQIGTRFKGNLSGNYTYKVVGIEEVKHTLAIVLDETTGRKYRIGLDALKRYDITVIEAQPE